MLAHLEVAVVEFMLLAAPRCGTTWAANWLTTDRTLCLHDPLWQHHYTELDAIKTDKHLGVACTGLFMWPEWLNAHPARKVILHRPLGEINQSLDDIGLGPVSDADYLKLDQIAGMHMDWAELWSGPAPIYEYLLRRPFDQERYDVLKEIEMQPLFTGLTINKGVTRKLMAELAGMGV